MDAKRHETIKLESSAPSKYIWLRLFGKILFLTLLTLSSFVYFYHGLLFALEMIAFSLIIPILFYANKKFNISWNLITIIFISSFMIIWLFNTQKRTWLFLIIGLVTWSFLTFPLVIQNLVKGKEAYTDFSANDFLSHLIFGYISYLIIVEFFVGENTVIIILYPVFISLFIGLLYEGIEYFSRNAKFSDLHFNPKNSAFDLVNHVIGCVIGCSFYLLFFS